jgi:signal transduction histidine kinase
LLYTFKKQDGVQQNGKMWYDTLIAILIVVFLLLIIASRITHQKISEMIRDIMDLINEKREEGMEHIGVYR